jgi:RNA polymerase sigma-70 factor (ECF subfamily)
MIERAAEGAPRERQAFAEQYLPAVRAYLKARWRGHPLFQECDDATQEVFVECFRSVLDRARRGETRSFRAFLYAVARNVARRFEERFRRREERLPSSSFLENALPANDESLSDVFDREWAVSLLARARERQILSARQKGDGAMKRVELLRLRLEEGLPIREIARRWECEASWLHHQYATAREEFRRALFETVAGEHSGTPKEIQRECARLVLFFR